jgi:iron complex outermembrane receptor protein
MSGRLIALFCSSALIAPAAVAQVTPAPVAAAPIAYSVGPGGLKQALESLARKYRIQLIYKIEDVAQERTRGVVGALTSEAALSAILAGTGLQAKRDSSGAIAIVPIERMTRTSTAAARDDARPAGSAPPPPPSIAVLDEIIVTATRSEEVLSRVPVSVAAYSQAHMDRLGVKQIDDLTRLTPGLNIVRGVNGSTNVSIRGVASTAGAPTTGIYIDETPVQIRGPGAGTASVFPLIFDLERIEVLRGPQGTLFGSGSQGGTIRFIQPRPTFESGSTYGRAELASIKHGGLSYEAGIAVGGPIVEGKIAFRASAFHRRDGGWIDRVTGMQTVVDTTGSLPGRSILFNRTGVPYRDANWVDSYALRLALALKPTEHLTITPSIFHQKQDFHDANFTFWDTASDTDRGDQAMPIYIKGPADARLRETSAPDLNVGDDRFYLPALLVEWDGPLGRLTSNTSYFVRDAKRWYDNTSIYTRAFGGGAYTIPLAGDKAAYRYTPRQRNLVQEIRLQSPDDARRLRWLIGAFLSHLDQRNDLFITVNFYETLPSYFGSPPAADGPPFGPGYSALLNYFGVPMLPDSGAYSSWSRIKEDQYAAFGQAAYRLTDSLTLTVGARVFQNQLHFKVNYAGPDNVLNAPGGRACVPGTGVGGTPCSPVAIGQYRPGEGPFAPIYNTTNVKQKEIAFAPRINLSWQADEANLFYATVSNGFRPGSAQNQLPSDCAPTLIELGFVDANGDASTPSTFTSDKVWNYEVGSKNKLFDNRLTIDASAFRIKWSGIQSVITINPCGYSFTTNLNNATSQGFDLSAQLRLFEKLTLGATVGYTKTSFDETTRNFSGGVIVSEGSGISSAGAPWMMALSAQYDSPPIAGLEPYARADLTYQSAWARTGQTDPQSGSYDAFQTVRPRSTLVKVRAGARRDRLDASVFVDNLFNTQPNIGLTHARRNPIWTNYTFQPRTVGMTVAYRY